MEYWKPTGRLTYVTCRHLPKLMFTHDGISVYAASKMDIDNPCEFGVVLNLTGYSMSQLSGTLVSGPSRWLSLNSYVSEIRTEEVLIDWRDGQALPVSRAFWERVWELIKAGRTEKVCVCCFGGHGRTGTAIAVLRILLLGESAEVAINSTRADICGEAIETLVQERYIYEMAGQKMPNYAVLEPFPRPKPVIKYFCGVCRDAYEHALNLSGRQFCVSCVKKAFKECEVTGDGRVKAVRDSLVQKATEAAARMGASFVARETYEIEEGITDAKGLEEGEVEAALGGTGPLTCDVCKDSTDMLHPAAIEDVPNAMVCTPCYRAYRAVLREESLS